MAVKSGKPTNPDRPLLNRHQASEYLNVSETTMYRMRLDGVLPWLKVAGKVMFRRQDLDAFIEESLVHAESFTWDEEL